jgi:hypothetical protein
MIKTTSQPRIQEGAADKPCPCGCAPCEKTCCELEPLVRPRYFCGQLLTDQDLQAQVAWSQKNFRLARYRDGWGVVCGLDVRCDPRQKAGLIVSSGYAIDCCGNSIILSEEKTVDLSNQCKEEGCADPRAPVSRKVNVAFEPAEAKAGQEQAGLCGMENGTAFDLYLYYQEEMSHPVAALGQGGCKHGESCEYSRVREGYRLLAVPVDTTAEVESPAEAWVRSYRRKMETIDKYFAGLEQYAQDGAAMRKSLLRWIDKHPLEQFCFLHDCIMDAATDYFTVGEKGDSPGLSSVLFWLVMDYRLSLLRCSCPACESDSGVPLARIWLAAPDPAAGKSCRILAVDDYSPYRRMLQPDDCWPADPGCTSLAQHIWQPADQVQRKLGLARERMVDFQPLDLAEISELLICDELQTCPGDDLYMFVLKGMGEPWDGRVVGFCELRKKK